MIIGKSPQAGAQLAPSMNSQSAGMRSNVAPACD
jgi:hypothetical protein